MIPSTALGELLMVGAVPVAAAITILAAILARRYRRFALGLAGLALALLAGMMITGRRLAEPLDQLRQAQMERFADFSVGWTREQVEASLGPPDLECAGQGVYVHQVMGTQELLKNLYDSTAERWIYFPPGVDEEPGGECEPRYADGEVGFNAEGRVIWYVELTEATFLNF